MNQNQKPEPPKSTSTKKTHSASGSKSGSTSIQKSRSENMTAYTSSTAPDFAKPKKKLSSRADTESKATVQSTEEPKKAPTARKPATQKRNNAQKKLRDTHRITASNPSDDVLDEALEELVTQENESDTLTAEPTDAPSVSEEKAPQGFFAKSAARREKRAMQKMSELEQIRKKSGFSEQDTDMMFELGYEDELGRVVGYENLKKLKQDHRERFTHPGKKHYRTSFGYCGEDTLSEDNHATIIAKYMHDRSFLILRTLLTALITVLLFLLDVPSLIGGEFEAFDISYPIIFPLLSLLLLIGGIALSYRQLNAGLRSFLKISPSPYSTPAIIIPFAVVYDIIALFLTPPQLRVNALLSGILLLLAVCDILRILCEMRVFLILNASEEKTVLELTHPRKKKLRQGKKLVKILNDDIDEAFYRVQKAEHISGFFRRFNSTKSISAPLRLFLGILPATAFVIAFIVSLISGLYMALSVFISVLFLTLPVSAIFSFFYPICRANRLLTHYNCALVGDESVSEYAESKTIVFNDADLYTAEKCTELSLKESDDLRRDIKLASILFRKIGGALDRIGRPPLMMDNDPAVTFVRVSDNGIEAIVDNRYHLIAGDANYLRKSGIRVPTESTDRTLRRTENVGVMYIAVDGILKLNYEIEYSVKPSFEALIADLAEIDTAVAIQSYDPNLNEAFLQISRDERAVPIRVIKPGRFESESVLKESDTGAVALGNMTDIVYPLHAARCVEKSKKLGLRLQTIFSACGAIAVIILSILSSLSILTPLLIAAYHIVCIAVSIIITRVQITKKSLHFKSEQP